MIQSSKSLTIEQFIPSEKFKDNYDRIFGKKPTILSWQEEAEKVVSSAGETPSEDETDATR
jgi:hypothetical protein